MKIQPSGFLLAFLLLAVPIAIHTGCGTNAPTKAAQAEQILIHSVNDGMATWATYVNAGKAKQSQIDTVHTAYNAYYSAQLVARATIEKAIAKDPSTSAADVTTANNAVTAAETSLLALLNQYILK